MAALVKPEPAGEAVHVVGHVKLEAADVAAKEDTKKIKRSHSAEAEDTKEKKRRRAGELIADPFPGHKRPSPRECRAARDALAQLHGTPDRPYAGAAAAENSLHTHTQHTVLDSLVRTILSQNTTDVNSIRAFASMKEAFPTWESVLEAPNGEVEAAIRSGGLAQTKTERIKAILAAVLQERGEISMEYLRSMHDEAIKAELSRFKGVGKKTVACVLMFCLGREDFPVDTHVWRISKALGWVPAKASRDQAYAHLSTRVPPEIRYDLHVLLVEHGKRCARCAKNGVAHKPSDGACPLVNLSAMAANF